MRLLQSLTLLVIITIFFNSEAKSELSIDTDLKILIAQSEEGNPDAKFYLGSLYYIGRELKQDYSKAIELFKEASDRGNIAATFNLGIIYAKGRGVEIDEKKAFEYYKKAAFGGLPQAQYNYALWLREGREEDPKPTEAMEWFKVSSNKNFDRSLIELAKGYENGTAGRRDYREAVKLYRRARANEDSRDNSPYFNSTFYLGKLYLRGLGVTKDEKKGLRFIKEAANGRVDEAIIEMAKIYEQGRYVKKDLKVALGYYSKLQNNQSIDVKDDIARIKETLNY
jgi:TPR repeat protein